MDGWIALHRKLLENPISKNPKYGWTWVCLLLMANHRDKETLLGNQMVTIKRGQLLTGRHALAKRTGVKEGTLEIILNLLESMKQIQQQKTNKYRLITVVNYNEYQSNQQQIDNRLTTELQQIDTNNNVNKDNNAIKNKRAAPSLKKSKTYKNTQGEEFTLDEITDQVLTLYNEVMKSGYKTLDPDNLEYWLGTYTLKEIGEAIQALPTKRWWCKDPNPTLIFRQKGQNKERVDYIGELLHIYRKYGTKPTGDSEQSKY